VGVRIVMLGAPGSGKGTHAARITAKYGVPAISTGDIFRANIANATELGMKAKAFMDKGELVPDDLVIAIVEDRLAQDDCRDGFLLDGFPRTVPQAEALEACLAKNGLRLDRAVLIDVGEDVLMRRLTGRRVCRSCGASFHVVNIPPRKEGVCDYCAGELYQRSDDNEETARNRIDVYNRQTAGLVGRYRDNGLLATVDGEAGLDAVFEEIMKLLA
jgi:adenylate kinase